MHCHFKEVLRLFRQLAAFLYVPCLHLAITINPVTFESFKTIFNWLTQNFEDIPF